MGDMNSLLKINKAGEKLVKNAVITSEEEVKIINVNTHIVPFS